MSAVTAERSCEDYCTLTKIHILNLLHRLIDDRPLATPPIAAPQALRLISEPLANVERYDASRGQEEQTMSVPDRELSARKFVNSNAHIFSINGHCST